MEQQEPLTFEQVREKATAFPDRPGVYLMKNAKRRIIYVGKAKSLRKRVRSYFLGDKDPKTTVLMKTIADIEYIVTQNEYDALILEINLIKQWSPKYNISLKDGKTYPVIRITNEPFPRVYRTRRIVLDGSEYYGPFPSTNQIDLYLELIERLFPLRKCRGPLVKRTHPCLYYHIKRCAAPCCGHKSGRITQEDYNATVDRVRKLLAGKADQLIGDLGGKMKAASESLRFEDAATIRDQINALRNFASVQQVSDPRHVARDYIGMAVRDDLCTFIILQHRSGSVRGREVFHSGIYATEEEALTQFVLQYYSNVTVYPRAILLPLDIPADDLRAFFREQRNVTVFVKHPVRGKHKRTMEMAIENANEDLRQRLDRSMPVATLEELKEALGLPALPMRIEGFDISHLAGRHTVASMVSFLNGNPDKASYRSFTLRSLGEGHIDDFASIREVIARRYTRVLNDELPRPDLILIDGGKGQVSAAIHILRSIGLDTIPLAGLAKENEEIHFPGQEHPLVLDRSSRALRLLQAVRDESHRFATSHNKRLRKKSLSRLVLEKVNGIGKRRSSLLLKKFGSIKGIINAGTEAVAAEAKVNEETAANLIAYLESLRGR